MLENAYTYWSVGELRKLRSLAKSYNNDWERIGRLLGRSPSACQAKDREMRTAEMVFYGKSDDTLRTYECKTTLSSQGQQTSAIMPSQVH